MCSLAHTEDLETFFLNKNNNLFITLITITAYASKMKYNPNARFNKAKEIAKIRKEQKKLDHFRNSKIKKNYSKICAKEGVESSRVRVNNVITSGNDQENVHKTKVYVKPNRFDKDIQISKKRIADKLTLVDARNKSLKEIQEAKRERNVKRKLFFAKTKLGQPKMDNRVKGLLEKLTTKL